MKLTRIKRIKEIVVIIRVYALQGLFHVLEKKRLMGSDIVLCLIWYQDSKQMVKLLFLMQIYHMVVSHNDALFT